MREESRLIFISKDQKKVKEYKVSRTKLFSYLTVFLILFAVGTKYGLDLLVDFSHNSKIMRLERTNEVLQTRLGEMRSKIDNIHGDMENIILKDDDLRLAMGISSISSEIREVGIGGAKYDYTEADEVSGFSEGKELGEQLTELARLEREVKLEYDSYHDLMSTFQNKQDSILYLPALRPVIKGRVSSKFGNRPHPLLKIRRHHDGIDISAKRGTPIYATADGIVKFAKRNGGYGRMVILDHKYGYQTRYGHMNKILARKGQTIKRGEKIGEVGNSGLSTAPHLHYEVRFKGEPINPDAYFFDDASLNQQFVNSVN